MAKQSVKPKSKPLYAHLRDTGMKKKKAAKIANRFVVTKRGDTTSSTSSKRRPKASGKKKTTQRRSSSEQAQALSPDAGVVAGWDGPTSWRASVPLGYSQLRTRSFRLPRLHDPLVRLEGPFLG